MPVTLIKKKASWIDPILAQAQLDTLRGIRDAHGLPIFCEWFLRILAKRELYKGVRSRLAPFILSKIQLDLTNTAARRNITLKPRQIGSTTWHILCRLFTPVILEPGTTGLLISQTKAYGAQHFRIFQRALKHFGKVPPGVLSQLSQSSILHTDMLHKHLLHTQYSARHEIVFDFLDSKVLVDTAENPDAGTGLTVNYLVGTEVAYWARDPESLLAQAKEAIPARGTIDLESTPNGMGGYFFEEWMRASEPYAEFKQHFYPWWWQEEYYDTKAVDEDSLSDEEERMMKQFEWTLKQVQWRRGKQISLRGKFPEKYPEDSTNCFLTSGDTFMDKAILREMKLRMAKERPLESFHDGTLKIYKRRVPGRRYMVGADVAEGKLISTENPDESAAVVVDIDSGEWMAVYRSVLPPEDFAVDLVDLAQLYNNAEIAVERNGPGGTVLTCLRDQLLYGNIYMHKEWLKERSKGQVMAKGIFVPGYPTSVRTRPMALNRLAAAVRERPEFIPSEDFTDQALTFIWRTTSKNNQFGKRIPQGAQGCKDDIVMAAACAEYCRNVRLGYLDPIETASERYGQVEAEEDAA